MRIRQVKPEFWSDERTAALVDPQDTALFYIGLWMQSDDAGYIKWEPRRIAAELYPYIDTTIREAAVLKHKVLLETMRKLRVFKCGHAVIPNLTRHQHLTAAYKRNFVNRDAHLSCSARTAAARRGEPRTAAMGRVGIGKGRVGNTRARAQKEPENGMATIEEHDAQRQQPLSEEEQAETWLTLWRNPTVPDRSKARAEKELQRLGYHREGKDWSR